MAYVDTNVVLRWLLGDHAQHSKEADLLIAKAELRSLFVPEIVIFEVVYVLGATGRSRQQISEAFSLVARTDKFEVENEELMVEVIGLYTETKLDLADCYLILRAKREKNQLITFDKGIKKQMLL